MFKTSRSVRFVLFLISVFSTQLFSADNSALPAPPIAKKVPKITEVNGVKLIDNYFWLRDKPIAEAKRKRPGASPAMEQSSTRN